MQLSNEDINFRKICKETYRKFIINEGIAKYKFFKKKNHSSDSFKTKTVRKLVTRIILEAIDQNIFVLFFDCSTIQNSSFKKQCWLPAKNLKHIKEKTFFTSLKVLAMISYNGLEFIQVFSKCNGQIVTEFLEESVKFLKLRKGINEIMILMDNATVNRVKTVKNLAKKYNIYILYNGIYSPQLNLIEYFFEFMKRDIRNSTILSVHNVLKNILKRARQFNRIIIKHYLALQAQDFRKALHSKDFFP